MSYGIGTGELQPQISSLPSAAAAAPIQSKQVGQEVKEAERSAAGADQTTLSSAGSLVSQALEGSDARTAKIASLQLAISSGNYNVSSSDVAEKLVKSMLE